MILSIFERSTQIPPTAGCTYEPHQYHAPIYLPLSNRKLTARKWPSKLVAPEYGMTGIRYLTAIFTTFTTSSVLAGHTTTDGCEPITHPAHQ